MSGEVLSEASALVSEIRNIMRSGRPRHSGEICDELKRRGVDVPPVVLGRLLRRIPELEQDGTVEVQGAVGKATREYVWRLK